MGVGLSPDVLVRDSSNLQRQATRVGVQRREAGISDFVVAEHLLHQ